MFLQVPPGMLNGLEHATSPPCAAISPFVETLVMKYFDLATLNAIKE